MLQEKIEHYKNLQIEIMELQQKVEKLMAEYKAQMKADFGICDGDTTNVLQLVEVVAKITSLK